MLKLINNSMKLYSAGSTLKNGAIVITHNVAQGKVLAVRPDTVQPYVIWSIDKAGECYWGHYFDNIADAANQFCGRKVRHQ